MSGNSDQGENTRTGAYKFLGLFTKALIFWHEF